MAALPPFFLPMVLFSIGRTQDVGADWLTTSLRSSLSLVERQAATGRSDCWL
jgi:hypothetical protein